MGVPINKTKELCILAYADDIVLIADGMSKLICITKIVNEWCKKWYVTINVQKTKCVHFRNRHVPRCVEQVMLGEDPLEWVSQYHYLGIILDKYMNCNIIVDQLSTAGSRALGNVLSKTKSQYDLGYQSFTTLVNTNVNAVTDYGSGAWSLPDIDCKKIDTIYWKE